VAADTGGNPLTCDLTKTGSSSLLSSRGGPTEGRWRLLTALLMGMNLCCNLKEHLLLWLNLLVSVFSMLKLACWDTSFVDCPCSCDPSVPSIQNATSARSVGVSARFPSNASPV
jgi:hypothetical protein